MSANVSSSALTPYRHRHAARRDAPHAVATVATAAAVARTLLMGLAVVLAGVALVLGGRRAHRALLSENPRYNLRGLQISTGNTVSQEAVRQVTGIREGVNLFTLRLPEIRRKFLLSLPNVRDIRIERRLPDALSVTVLERIPMARLSRSGRVVVDFDGYLFVLQPAHESLVDTLPILATEEWASLQPGQRIGARSRAALIVQDVAESLRLSFRIAAFDATASHYLLLQTTERHEIALPWDALERRDAITTMLVEVSTVIASPRSAGFNRFDVSYADGRVFARYQ